MKTNNHPLIFSSFFLGISFILVVVLQKYLVLFFHHTITFCREMAKTISFGLADKLGIFVALTFFLMISITLIKFFSLLFKTWSMRRNLQEKTISINKNYVVVDSSKPFAFCFGIINPKIYVSNKLIRILSKKEFKTVIAHENYHLKNHDTIVLSLASILQSLFPYLPIISDLIKNYRIDRELMADQFAVLQSGGNNNLIAVLKKLLNDKSQYSYSSIPAIAELDTLEPRINKLINNYDFVKRFKLKNLIISFISVFILVSLAILPVNAVELHSSADDVAILCVDKMMSTYYTL